MTVYLNFRYRSGQTWGNAVMGEVIKNLQITQQLICQYRINQLLYLSHLNRPISNN